MITPNHAFLLSRRTILVAGLACVFLFPLLVASTPGQSVPVNVVVFSKGETSPLITALTVDTPAVSMSLATNGTLDVMNESEYIELLDSADVFYIDRWAPHNETWLEWLVARVNGTVASKGLVMLGFMQEENASLSDFSAPQLAILAPILPVVLDGSVKTTPDDPSMANYSILTRVVLDDVEIAANVFTRWIPWGSCPRISRRVIATARPGRAIVTGLDEETALLADWVLPGGGTVTYLGIVIQDHNIGFGVWPYFNYLIHVCTHHAAPGIDDDDIVPFHSWPHAPLPKPHELALYFTLIGACWVTTIGLFVYFKAKVIKKKKKGIIPEKYEPADSFIIAGEGGEGHAA